LTLDYKITVLANGVGLAPSFDTPRPIAGGFTTNITNCDPLDFNYTATVNGNAVGYTAVQSAGSGQCLVTVSGLTAGQAATLAVTATPKVGSLPSLPAPATASVSAFAGSSLATAPVLTSVVRNIGGFTATIANYDPTNYTYSVSSSAPGSAATDNGSVTATSIDVNVTGLADGGSATLSVTATSKFGLGSATTLIVGTAQANNVVTPTLASKDAPSTVDANTRTFSVKITNYNASYDYSCDVLATDILFAAVPDSCTLTTSGSDHIMTFVINVSTGTTGDIWHYLVVAGKNGQYSNSNSIDYTLGDAGSYLVN
jgi:hypothetical protein